MFIQPVPIERPYYLPQPSAPHEAKWHATLLMTEDWEYTFCDEITGRVVFVIRAKKACMITYVGYTYKGANYVNPHSNNVGLNI